MAHTTQRAAHERKREWAVGFVAHGNDLVAAQDEPEPGERELPTVTEGERQVAARLAQRTEEILARALAKRQQLEDAQREARERAAAAFKRWDAARWAAHKPAEGTYGRLTCSLCGEPSATQECGGCSEHFKRGGAL
jgi:hypothetical protein